jgi:steroid 5-alpha reductase family enzyme
MSFPEFVGLSLAIVVGYMTVLWLLSLALRNASIVDVFWGLGFVVLAFAYFAGGDGFVGRRVLITTLVTIWGLRLTQHILRRNWGKGEDYRYRDWRERWGEKFWWRSLFQVFLLQGILLWLISAPLLAAQFHDSPDNFTAVDIIGALVWGVGLYFEAVGDWQLARFKADPASKGEVMRTGLWRYTRHPNYFGDATVWWGLFIIAAATGDGAWSIFAPILMTFLLLRVSGVTLLEKKQAETKPQYRDYVESTSAFLPWFPRSRRG